MGLKLSLPVNPRVFSVDANGSLLTDAEFDFESNASNFKYSPGNDNFGSFTEANLLISFEHR